MKVRLARLGVLLAGVLALMGTMVPSASADTLKTVTFAGEAELECGLGYFLMGPGGPAAGPDLTKTPDPVLTTKTNPKGTPQANINPNQGNRCNFRFSDNGTCIKTSVGKKTGENDQCTIRAAGIVSGFCGWSTGEGLATITNLTGGKDTFTESFKFTGIGGVLSVTGGNMETNFLAEVLAVPVGGGSCTNKGGNIFQIAGEVLIKDCTNGTTLGTCLPDPLP